MSEKSILEKALLKVQNLEEAVKQNAKGILASTMKQELNDLLKEQEEEEEEETLDSSTVEEQPTPEEDEDDMSDDESENDEDPDNLDDDSEDESEDEGDESEDMDSEMDSDMNSDMDSDMGSDDNVLDMTKSSDSEVMKVFKLMKPEDGIIVKKDGDAVSIDTGDNEFLIKLNENEEWGDESDDMSHDHGMSDEMSENWDDMSEESDEMSENWDEMSEESDEMSDDMGEETVYEIELDGEDGGQIEATEAARTKSNPHGNKGGMNRSGLPSKKKYKAGSGVNLNEEVEKLRKQNSEYKKALILFKDKLNEVAVFNANLAYATRLFTENTTTKQEKMNILKRFDSVSTMNESKNLFQIIKSELETKKPVTETVVEKITNTPTSSSKDMLSESKAYENPQFKRMKDLMSKIK